jgi:hypothetical protein
MDASTTVTTTIFVAIVIICLIFWFSKDIVGFFLVPAPGQNSVSETERIRKAACFRLSFFLIVVAAALHLNSIYYMKYVTLPKIDATLKSADNIFASMATTLIQQSGPRFQCSKASTTDVKK